MKLKHIKNIYTALLITSIMTACSDKKASETSEGTDSSQTSTTATIDSGAQEKEITFTKDQYRLAGIETGAVEKRNLSGIIKLNGVIDVEPASNAVVSAPMGGYMKSAGLLPGEAIRKGQVLATIENPEFITLQQDYLESKGKLQYLEQEFQRQQKLREADVNAAKTFQQIESDFKVMQARISGLEQRLEIAGVSLAALQSGKIVRTGYLYAPISGFVKTSNVIIGKYVNPTDVLFELVDKSDLHLALNAFEKGLNLLDVGQKVKFSLANENKYDRRATIFLIGQASGQDKMIPIHCHLEKKNNPDLIPGMYVKAWVETGTQEQNAVPAESLVQLEGKDYVIVQSKSRNGFLFQLRQVKKGIEQEGYTAIDLPLKEAGQQMTVVTKNAYAVLSAIKNAEEEE